MNIKYSKPILQLLAGVCLFLILFSFDKGLSENKKKLALQIMMEGLNQGHYSPLSVDDSLSKHVFDLYLKRIDFRKNIFTQQDIDALKKYEYQLDEEIKGLDFTFFTDMTKVLDKSIKETETVYKSILSNPFNFEIDENIEMDPDKQGFPKNEEELNERWRQTLKYQTLIYLTELMENQEKAAEKSDTVKIKSFEVLEQEARQKVLKSTDDYYERLNELEISDWYNLYLNTIANVFDPHTEFFPPKEKKNFDISMTGQLEGIGAQLQEKDGYIKVTNIVPGSASWRQGELKAGDIILKVAQGIQDPVDVVGMRLDNAVELIRGKKGTEVRLTVKKLDGTIVVIPIMRDIVVLEETYAQSVLIKNKERIGYIKLPVFYSDFTQRGSRRSSTDIEMEINKLKSEKVDGIILDLRDNGGGSLQDAIDMAGLFITKGPIVQVQTKFGVSSVMEDKNPRLQYDGPLVVMVNYNSASASEILAAAMQDYKRAVIVGSPNTFGKGTVQKFLDLDNYLITAFDSLKPLGSLKVTFQKFYRINGGSTQLKGVTPDIVLPDINSYVETGEKDLEFPIPWDEINPAYYSPSQNGINMEKLKKNSEIRVNENLKFSQVKEKSLSLKKLKENSIHTLQLSKYQQERKEIKDSNKEYEDVTSKPIDEMDISILSIDKPYVEADTARLTRKNEWIKNLKKDFYLYEATRILSDM